MTTRMSRTAPWGCPRCGAPAGAPCRSNPGSANPYLPQMHNARWNNRPFQEEQNMPGDTNTPPAWLRAAYASGHATAVAALALIEGTDIRIEETEPPNLSGEYAESANPRDLFQEVTGLDAHAEASWQADAYHAVVQDLCDQWELAAGRVWKVAQLDEEIEGVQAHLQELHAERRHAEEERDINAALAGVTP
jgi:hypothetical protein